MYFDKSENVFPFFSRRLELPAWCFQGLAGSVLGRKAAPRALFDFSGAAGVLLTCCMGAAFLPGKMPLECGRVKDGLDPFVLKMIPQ